MKKQHFMTVPSFGECKAYDDGAITSRFRQSKIRLSLVIFYGYVCWPASWSGLLRTLSVFLAELHVATAQTKVSVTANF